MKIFFPLFFFIATFIVPTEFAFSQVIKLKTTDIAFKEKKNNVWQEWDDWNDSSILITVDLDLQRIIVYSSNTQKLDIAKYEGVSVNDNEENVISFLCVDEDAYEVLVRFIKDKNENYRQMYLHFNEIKVAFNIYRIN